MTVWTKRSSAPVTVWLEGELVVKKMPNNFYYIGGGIVGGLSPVKRVDNFIDLAGAAYPGEYDLGKTVDNFLEIKPR